MQFQLRLDIKIKNVEVHAVNTYKNIAMFPLV